MCGRHCTTTSCPQKLCDGLKATHYNEENEVDKIVEGVCIHYKVHDVHPTLQGDDLKQDKKNNSAFMQLYVQYITYL